MKTKTLVLGVGNPILGDDGVGIKVSGLVKEHSAELENVDVCEGFVGGLPLAESMLGYDTVIVIDATSLGGGREGEITILNTDDLNEALHLTNPHDLNFTTALSLMRRSAGRKMPKTIRIYGIRIRQANLFSESLTPKIAAAAGICAKMVLSELKFPALSMPLRSIPVMQK